MEAVKKWLTQRENHQLLGLLVCGLLLRGAIAVWLPPGFDEGYYYLYTRHPDWSYFDHPLLVALTTGFGPWLTGLVSPFTIRLGTLLLHTGSLLLLDLTSARLFSTRAATLTLAIATLVPIFQLGFGVLTLPDSPLMFFWTAALYVAVCEFFEPQDAKQQNDTASPLSSPASLSPSVPLSPLYRPSYKLAIVGLLVGLACLGKYHGLALGFGLLGFCLTNSRYRAALLSPWMLASLGLFLLAISPIVVWNAQHDWVSLRFQSGRAVPDRGYSLLDLLVTFLAGVAYLFPTFGFPLWWVSGKALVGQLGRGVGTQGDQREQLKTQNSNLPHTPHPTPHTPHSSPLTSLILWLALPLMLIFTFMGGYRSILPTWAMPGFWGATLLLGQQAVSWQRRTVKRWLVGSGLVITSLLLVALLHVTIGTLQKPSRYAWFGGFLTPSNDASTQLIDIQQLRRGFADSPLLTTAMQATDFFFTNDIYLAGQLGMAIAPLNPKPITCFDKDLRGFAFWSTRDEWVGQSGLLVTTAVQARSTVNQYQEYFKEIQKIAAIPIQRGGSIVQVIEIYQCKTMLQPYPRPYGR
ncbi:ArnT family glycosyltransferase [Stenomitos frigidus]|uniref:Glycosyltransferase n=1 Tax=Stenomitos frigidus ULC18 TaxID=2107698 RepID=A0A2T1E0R7_9CYAN|nr:glycosyltransferase family 39 protein [Stenomitos frigidus]PSB26281.1 glycosyltransferase [Stenomitos frigidus ULC18]